MNRIKKYKLRLINITLTARNEPSLNQWSHWRNKNLVTVKPKSINYLDLKRKNRLRKIWLVKKLITRETRTTRFQRLCHQWTSQLGQCRKMKTLDWTTKATSSMSCITIRRCQKWKLVLSKVQMMCVGGVPVPFQDGELKCMIRISFKSWIFLMALVRECFSLYLMVLIAVMFQFLPKTIWKIYYLDYWNSSNKIIQKPWENCFWN